MLTGEDVRVRGQKRRMGEEMTLTLTLTLTPTLTLTLTLTFTNCFTIAYDLSARSFSWA